MMKPKNWLQMKAKRIYIVKHAKIQILAKLSKEKFMPYKYGHRSTLTVDFLEKKLHLPPAERIPINIVAYIIHINKAWNN